MTKKNFLKIPQVIIDRLNAFAQDDVVAACAKLVRNNEIQRYAKLGLKIEADVIVTPQPFVPHASAGRYSKTNTEGKVVKRTDLPMEKKTQSFEAPSWKSGHTHTVSWSRDIYQREWIAPKGVQLQITVVERQVGASVLKFSVDEVINRRTPNFENELLFNLNVLQENVGAADVMPSAATLAEYAETVRVDWELLPAGTPIDQIVANIKKRSNVDAPTEAAMRERLAVMERLTPEKYVIGTSGFAGYFGAQFGADFVAFENIRYGNALYVMRENWQVLSKKSRIELMAGNYEEVTRIEHRDGWSRKLTALVRDYRIAQRKGLL
jgi:hypothetical protein